MPKDFDRFPGPPIRVDDTGATRSIRARSRRGTIGSTWWSRRFIDVLESLELGGRLARARSYARAGQVLDLTVAAGAVTATVQGSRPEPYQVRVELAQIWPERWERVERRLAEQVIFSAKLLAGELPEELEDVFTDLGLSLFPEDVGELAMECGCPDWSVPCKHVAATLYLLAEAFDRDPFLILCWRGRGRTELLDNLRRLRAPEPSPVDDAGRPALAVLREVSLAPLAECVDTYFSCQGRAPRLTPEPGKVVVPDAILHERDQLLVGVRGRLVADVLRPAYAAMGPKRTR